MPISASPGLTVEGAGRTWQNFMAAGIHPTMHKTKHLFDYHFAKYISIHDALPWEQYPAVGEPPLKSTMIAHANNLLRYITAKTSPWKSEFAEMAKVCPLPNGARPFTKSAAHALSNPLLQSRPRSGTKFTKPMATKRNKSWFRRRRSGLNKTLQTTRSRCHQPSSFKAGSPL